jgi:hypothetical protein
MKIKSFITFSLLFAISFSIVHEYAFAFYDDEHCDTTEYVKEFQGPVAHDIDSHESSAHEDDICDTHFEYHQAFLLLPNATLFQDYDLRSNITLAKETYQFQTNQKFIKPPIS